MDSLLFNYILDHFGTNNMYWIFYALNLIFGIIAYKLGFARKLPLLKSIIVYIMLAIGMFVVTIFSVFNLPITETLIIISVVLGIYRFRLYQESKKLYGNNQSSYRYRMYKYTYILFLNFLCLPIIQMELSACFSFFRMFSYSLFTIFAQIRKHP